MPKESYQGEKWAPHTVALLVDDGSNPFEMACVCEVFGSERPEIGFEPYSLRIVSPSQTTVMRNGLFQLSGVDGLEAVADADTVITPNRPDTDAGTRPAVLDAIRAAHQRGARLVGLCTGAYTLAEAGVLAGRRATVHWQLLDHFKLRHPDVQVQPDVLFVDEGDVLTSAGSAAALDLSLHIVRKDWGADIANLVSRRLVFSAFREGGQQQFIEHSVPETTAPSLAKTVEWMRKHLGERISIADMAEHANMSLTSFHRRFRAETGTTPLAWLTTQRVHHAQRLLERADITVAAAAHRSGLGTTANLRALMKRHLGVGPAAYRRQFVSS